MSLQLCIMKIARQVQFCQTQPTQSRGI